MKQITIKRPDDWHVHFRDSACLKRTVADTARTFARAIVMPNLAEPITTIERLTNYQKRIEAAIPPDTTFTPLMTFYLTETLSEEVLQQAKAQNLVTACKYYPAGATTRSEFGVKQLKNIKHLLKTMEELDIVLCLHGEVVTESVDIFDRERYFIEQELSWLLEHFPNLRVVLEHISTKEAARFVAKGPDNLAATITAHHMLLNRNHLLKGGIRPDYYCLPILKTAEDQAAIIEAALSDSGKFFLGTDSAPHAQKHKYSCCGCAGIYTAHCAIELYAQVFMQHNMLDRLENFASVFGPRFYKLKENSQSLTLVNKPWGIPKTLDFGEQNLTPFFAGETINWQILS
jgi:dihydroorotase